MIMAMIQLLKFDVRLFQNDKKMNINKNVFTDIDLIVQNKKVYISFNPLKQLIKVKG